MVESRTIDGPPPGLARRPFHSWARRPAGASSANRTAGIHRSVTIDRGPREMRPGGLEPPTLALGVPCSIQLSYGRMGGHLPVAKGRVMQTQIGSEAATTHIPPMSSAPAGFSIERDLPEGFAAFYRPLHDAFTARQQAAIVSRAKVLAASIAGQKPAYPTPGPAQGDWRIELPAWCADQRNQMTGPADDHELGVKMLNSGAPGVMIDLEDSMANDFAHTLEGIDNTVKMYYGELTYVDKKRGGNVVGIKPSSTVLWTRVRGLHLSQAGIYDERRSLRATLRSHPRFRLVLPSRRQLPGTTG